MRLLEDLLRLAESELDTLLEAPLDMPEGSDINAQIGILIQRLESARRALGITNKLQDPAERKKHRSRVMSFLNQIRGMLDRLINEFSQHATNDMISRRFGVGASAPPGAGQEAA